MGVGLNRRTKSPGTPWLLSSGHLSTTCEGQEAVWAQLDPGMADQAFLPLGGSQTVAVFEGQWNQLLSYHEGADFFPPG